MRGRKPQAADKLKLTGGYRADRHGSKSAMIAAGKAIEPSNLPGDVSVVWREYADTLTKNGLLKNVDSPVFEIFAREFARWRRLEKMVQDTGGDIIMVAGVPKTNPALREAQKARDAMLAAAREFGMTPSARRNVNAKPGSGGISGDAGEIIAAVQSMRRASE